MSSAIHSDAQIEVLIADRGLFSSSSRFPFLPPQLGQIVSGAPEDISESLDVEEELPADAGASVLEMFRRTRNSIAGSEFDGLPSDGAQNFRRYLYCRNE